MENGVAWFPYSERHDGNPKFQFRSVEYRLGLLTNDNRVKAQGRMFQALGVQAEGEIECEGAHGLIESV
jgi:hypothetical protein